MSFVMTMPQGIDAAFAGGFSALALVTGALPYRIEGVAVVGEEGVTAPPIPSLLRLCDSNDGSDRLSYRGSIILSELLESSPREAMVSYHPFDRFKSEGIEGFESVVEGKASARKLISLQKGRPVMGVLARRYALMSKSLRGGIPPERGSSHGEAGRLLAILSPTALAAADRSNSVKRFGDGVDHEIYAGYALLFLAGAFAAAAPGLQFSQFALHAFSSVSEFFLREADSLDDGEALAIRASTLEIVADMLRHAAGPAENDDALQPHLFSLKAASVWAQLMQRHPSSGDLESVFPRALNAAQIASGFETMENLFLMALGRETTAEGRVQFLIRTAWAALMGSASTRSKVEMWKLVAAHLRNAGEELSRCNLRSSARLSDRALDLGEEADRIARELDYDLRFQ